MSTEMQSLVIPLLLDAPHVRSNGLFRAFFALRWVSLLAVVGVVDHLFLKGGGRGLE